MQMIYNSDSFVVVQFSLTDEAEALHPGRGGFEIVDKFARKEIYLQGAVAESFQCGVEALANQDPSEDSLDQFIAGFTALAQHPVLLH